MKTLARRNALATLAMLTALLAACAAPPPAAAPSSPAAAPAATEAPKAAAAGAATATPIPPTPTPQPVIGACDLKSDKEATISLLGNKFPIMEFYAAQLKSCEQGNIKVNVDWLPSAERKAKADAILSSSDASPYEVIQAVDTNLAEWATKGWLLPIDDLVAKYKDQYKLGDIPQELWDAMKVDGKTYGFPLIQNMQVLFYRKDLLDKHNIAVPTTYDEIIAASKKLMEAKDVEYGYAAVYEKAGISTEFSNMLRANGGDWFDADKPIFNGEKGVQVINKMKELMTVMPPDVLTFSNDKAMIAIQQGQVAMAHLYVTRAARMDDPKQSKFPNLVQYAVSPSFAAGGIPGTTWFRDMYVVPKNTKTDADLIFRGILEATKQERQMAGSTLAMVSRASVVDDPAVKANPINRYMPTVLASLKAGAKGNPRQAYFGLASAAIGATIHDALTGAITPEDALAKATEEFTTQAKDKGFLK